MKPRTAQWGMLLSAGATGAGVAFPWILKFSMFLLLTFIFGIVVRLLLSFLVLLWSLSRKPVPVFLLLSPIPVGFLFGFWMIASVGWYKALGRTADLSQLVLTGLEKAFSLPWAIGVLILLVWFGNGEYRALQLAVPPEPTEVQAVEAGSK